MVLRSCLVAPVLLTALSLAPSLRAQERDGDLERARALFDEAGELERQGQWPAAQDRLRVALRIRETANLRYALGWALANDDKRVEARSEYAEALRLAQHAGNHEVSKLASARIAELDRQSAPSQVRAKGEIAREPASTVVPWVVLGSGGVLVAGGVLLLASSSSDASTRDDTTKRWCDATACVGGTTATRPETTEAAGLRREAYDAASRGNAKQVVGGILGGVGAVGIGVGIYMLLRGPAHETPARTAISSMRIDAAPLAGGGLAGASFSF